MTDAPENVTTARAPGIHRAMLVPPTDNVEAAAAWLLMALGLVVAALSLMIGAGVYHDGMRRAGFEAGDRTRVEAVVLGASEAPRVGTSGGQYGRLRPSAPAEVPVRYSGLDEVEHVAVARPRGPVSAGTPVWIWLDDTSAVVAPPRYPVGVLWDAATAALGVLALGGLVLATMWAAVRTAVRRSNLARWEREWAQVEPRWSGRAQR